MKKILFYASCLCALLATSCSTKKDIEVIPYPSDVKVDAGSFNVAGAQVYAADELDTKTKSMLSNFAEQLSVVTGKSSALAGTRASGLFEFSLNPQIGAEAYTLKVEKNGVKVEASDFNGFLYAVETIKQMLPAEVYGKVKAEGISWKLPCCVINDAPRFAYRGMHLDCARHFFSVDEVKKYLDIMAIYKLNTFHWHLTEDQGWRLEIKKYPKLTEIGSYRNGTVIKKDWNSNDGIRYGGYYTQEEVKDIVKYADNLGITIIPEIDLPGHMLAALAAYPYLGCTGGPYEVETKWGVFDDVLCVGKESTFEFLEDVLTEVMELFPSEYIHIGGDECPKSRWKECPRCQKRIKELGLKDGETNGVKHTKEQLLQNYVTARIQKYLGEHGRKIIGWDEILEGQLQPGATVMSWRGTAGGIKAANMGFDAIMTPNSYDYFDYYQSHETDKEPFAIGGYLPVERVYEYEPLAEIPEDAHKHILGVQANLWTEYVATNDHLEYMLLPRMAALSEVQWSLPTNKNLDRFKNSLVHAFNMYDVMGYAYCKDVIGVIGLPGQEQKARTPEELEEYMNQNK